LTKVFDPFIVLEPDLADDRLIRITVVTMAEEFFLLTLQKEKGEMQ